MTIWAYYRVSTEMQDYNSQKTDVLRCCKQFDWNIDKEIIDLKVKELEEQIEKIKNGKFSYKQARRRFKEELKCN